MFKAFYTPQDVMQRLRPFWNDANIHTSQLQKDIYAKDTAFKKRSGLLMAFNQAARRPSDDFSHIHATDFRENARPSLPAMALEYSRKLGLPQDGAAYKALMMVSLRAEADIYQTQIPSYHSTNHYADVFALMANFLLKSKTDKHSAYLGLIAAMGHDLAHPGTGNPPHDPYQNERAAFEIMKPLLQEAGLSVEDISKIDIMLKTTSPNGPHSILKAVANNKRAGNNAPWDEIDAEDRFPELKILSKDASLLELCAMLSDADLFTSAGAGMETQIKASQWLTAEERAAGKDIDFTTDKARMFFFDHIVGKEGFVSRAGRDLGNDSYFKMRQTTQKALRRA